MTEWEFLSEVVELADCGILLDVNNIYVSSKNHNFDPYDYLNNVPHHRVGQIHIAGHSKFEKYLLDTHDHPVLDPVWQMYAHAIKLVGSTATLLEWDDRIPSLTRSIMKRSKPTNSATNSSSRAPRNINSPAELRELQRVMSTALFRPLTPRWRMQKRWIDGRPMEEAAADFIKPNDRLSSFERFLKEEPHWSAPRQELARDMVRFEWAQVVAFDGPAKPPDLD